MSDMNSRESFWLGFKAPSSETLCPELYIGELRKEIKELRAENKALKEAGRIRKWLKENKRGAEDCYPDNEPNKLPRRGLPDTIEAWRRHCHLIGDTVESQREEIANLSQKVNKLKQKVKKCWRCTNENALKCAEA